MHLTAENAESAEEDKSSVLSFALSAFSAVTAFLLQGFP
jgi:hypothetical protein